MLILGMNTTTDSKFNMNVNANTTWRLMGLSKYFSRDLLAVANWAYNPTYSLRIRNRDCK